MTREVTCPECGGPMLATARRCKPCRTASLRRFCVYCGRPIDARALTCREHATLPGLDWRYRGVVESPAMNAAPTCEDTQADKGRGR